MVYKWCVLVALAKRRITFIYNLMFFFPSPSFAMLPPVVFFFLFFFQQTPLSRSVSPRARQRALGLCYTAARTAP